MRLAYRFYDVKTQYTSGLLDAPLLAKHRAFSNFSYQTKNKWSFDYTFQWIGQKPLPGTAANHHGDKFANYSEDFFLSNIQVSKSFFNKQLEVYAGIENLFNFQQHHAILNANNPRDEYFDATLIWGPIFGRMEYAGLRWKPQFKSTK
jgi:outer membrane receptor for ferrienterochelin and colicin